VNRSQVVGPTGLTVTVRELTGEEIKAVKASTNAQDDGGYLINQCLVSVDALGDLYKWPEGQLHVDDLVLGDLTELLVAIRVATFGPDFTVACTCPYCQTSAEYTPPGGLNALPRKAMDPEAIDRLRENRPFETRVAGTVVKWLPARRRQQMRASKSARLDPSSAYALGASLRVIEIVGVHENDKLAWLEKLGVGTLQRFMELCDFVDGGIETRLELRCSAPACNAVFGYELPLDRKLWDLPQPKWRKSGQRPDFTAIG
jgi:hypothetical protein